MPENNINDVEEPSLNKKVNYKKLCVVKRKGTYYYPKSLAKERENYTTYILVSLCLLIFMFDLYLDSFEIETILIQYASGMLYFILLQILYRLILTYEELKHLTSRYEGSLKKLLKDTFDFQIPVWITFFICSIYCVFYISTYGWLANGIGVRKLLMVFTFCYLLEKILNLSKCMLRDSLWIGEDNGLDYGSGMAYSFFYGYLNLVLPKTGTEDKNLKEIMQIYESKNHVKFETYKLFILIPKSMHCFTSLQNEYSKSVMESSSLEEKIITVAGVKDRVYKNAVYKIVTKSGKKLYVSAEYATPLKTFANVFNSAGPHLEYYDKLKKDIILQFYITLRNILEEKKLSQFCEPIYYEDTFLNSRGDICYHDIGYIIQARLQEFEKVKDE